jgi:hypothetical protein
MKSVLLPIAPSALPMSARCVVSARSFRYGCPQDRTFEISAESQVRSVLKTLSWAANNAPTKVRAKPAMLQKANPDLEVINAVIDGYTITDELSLFVERAQLIAPDITILQVLDNDLYGPFYFKMNDFDRKKGVHIPSLLEEAFLKQIVRKNTMQNE